MKVTLTHHCHRHGCAGAMGDVIDVNEADARWLASIKGAVPADEQAQGVFGKPARPAAVDDDDDEGPVLEEQPGEPQASEEVKPETTDVRQGQKPETATKPAPKRKPKK